MMQKYISRANSNDVRYFKDGIDVGSWLDLDIYRLMTDEEIKKHEALRETKFHTVWNGEQWIDIRSTEEKLAYERSQYSSLTRYQFKRCLLENGFRSADIEAQILTIEDEMTRELTMLGFKEATNFVRTDDSIIAMQGILGLSDEQIDDLWEYALKL